MFIDTVKEFKLDALIPQIKSKMRVIPIPVLDEDMKKHYENARTREFEVGEKIIFVYNHRLQLFKKYTDTFEALHDLWKEGYKNFEVHLSYASGDNVKKVAKEYPFIKILTTHTHEEYYERLTQPHFNITTSGYETFSISIADSALLGGIPIIPKTTVFPELVPDNYPFFFNDKKELKNIVRNILTKGYHPDYLKEIKKEITKTYERFNSDDIGKTMYETIERMYLPHIQGEWGKFKKKKQFIKVLNEHNNKPWVLNDAKIEIRKKLILGNQALQPWRIIMLLETLPHSKYFNKGMTTIVPKL
jgi:hypothetical protein